MTKQDQIDKANEAFHSAASDLGNALEFACSHESDGQTIEAFGKAVIIARRMIAADEQLHALGNAGYEDATIRTDQRLADTLRGAAERIVTSTGNHPKAIEIRGLIEELVRVELPGAPAI